jgi:hypothetical protein
MSVVINTISETQCLLVHPNGERVGFINSHLELLDVLVQIKEQQLTGYTISWKGQTIRIDRNGTADKNPDGFYTESVDLLLKLV